MCGRFENSVSLQDLILLLDPLKLSTGHLNTKLANIAPTDSIISIYTENKKLHIEQLHWGIKFSHESPLIFNTRIETITEKPFWKKLYNENRCLVPMTGFYEWKKSGSNKIPFRLFLPDEPLFFVAALYANNKQKEKEVSLITTTSNKFVSAVHHRMPIIIHADEVEKYFADSVEENVARSHPLDESITMEMEPTNLF